MTDGTTQPMGECPNSPEDPVSDETYETWMAAMDSLIAEAPRLHTTAPLTLRRPRTLPSPVLRGRYRAADGLRRSHVRRGHAPTRTLRASGSRSSAARGTRLVVV
jgi:hypothetical protein